MVHNRPRWQVVGSGLIVAWLAMACLCNTPSPTNVPTQEQPPVELYQQTLNLTPPAEITNFTVAVGNLDANFLSAAYFTYQAKLAYFDLLQAHTQFATASEFNEAIYPTKCTPPNFPADFSFWTTTKIELTNKRCYTGTYYPYVHYLIYDETTLWVDHFVAQLWK